LVLLLSTYKWKRTKALFFVLGLLIGFTAIIKANILYSVPFLVLAIIIYFGKKWQSSLKFSLLIILGVIIPILPVTIYNWQASHSLVLINYSGGPNVYIGNWQGADGSLKPPEFISLSPQSEESSWVKMTEAYLGDDVTPAQVSSYWIGRAWQEAMSDKNFFVDITTKKIILLFHSMPLDDNYSIEYAMDKFALLTVLWPFWIVAVLGITGMIMSLWQSGIEVIYRVLKGKKDATNHIAAGSGEKPNLLFLYAVFFGYALTLVASHIAERYRLALAPILAVFAGYFLALVWKKIQSISHMDPNDGVSSDSKNASDAGLYDIRNYKNIVPIMALLIFLIYLAFSPLGQISRTTPEDTLNNLGSEAMDLGKMDIAEASFKESIELQPRMSPAYANLGKLYLEEGNVDQAIEEERKALEFQPDASTALLKIAMEAKQNSTPLNEIKSQINALSNNQEDELFDADYIEAVALIREQKYQDALPLLLRANDKFPNNSQILVNLGTVYKNLGQLDDAKWNLSLAIIADGYNLPARYNMVNVQRKKGENDLAMTQLMLINNIVPGYMLSQLQLAELQLAKGNVVAARNSYQAFLDDNDNASQYPDEIQKVTDMVAKLSYALAHPNQTSPAVGTAPVQSSPNKTLPAQIPQTQMPSVQAPPSQAPSLTPAQIQDVQNELKNNN